MTGTQGGRGSRAIRSVPASRGGGDPRTTVGEPPELVEEIILADGVTAEHLALQQARVLGEVFAWLAQGGARAA